MDAKEFTQIVPARKGGFSVYVRIPTDDNPTVWHVDSWFNTREEAEEYVTNYQELSDGDVVVHNHNGEELYLVSEEVMWDWYRDPTIWAGTPLDGAIETLPRGREYVTDVIDTGADLGAATKALAVMDELGYGRS